MVYFARIFLALAFFVLSKGFTLSSFSALFIYILIIGLYIKFLIPWSFRRNFRKQKLLHDERTMTFKEDGFSLDTKMVNSFIKYEAIEELRVSDDVILLYVSPYMFHFVPLKVFTSETEKEDFLMFLEKRLVLDFFHNPI